MPPFAYPLLSLTNILCFLSPKNDIASALLKVCFQHNFEVLFLAPSSKLAFYQFRVDLLTNSTAVKAGIASGIIPNKKAKYLACM